MSRIREILDEVTAALPPEATSFAGDGRGRLTVNGVELSIAFEDEGSFFCSANIGSFERVSDPDLILEDALKANCFWNATKGSTLSVNPATGEMELADRREVDFVENAEQLAAYFESFADVVIQWREYVANCSSDGTPEATPPASAPEGNENNGPEFRILV